MGVSRFSVRKPLCFEYSRSSVIVVESAGLPLHGAGDPEPLVVHAELREPRDARMVDGRGAQLLRT